MKQSSQFVKRFDIFSKPFLFSVGDKRNKSTLMGGLLSVIIFGVSVAYFYYLINMYFSNQFQPRITSRVVVATQDSELFITENQMVFEFLMNGEPLKIYEKRVGKTYLSYLVTYNYFYADGTTSADIIPTIECTDERFVGFLCFDEAAIKSKPITQKPLELYSTNYEIIIKPCDSTIEINCATPEEIYATIFVPINFFQVFTKIQQYNPNSLSYEDQYKSEYIYFDPNFFLFSRFSLFKATTTVTSGILIQTSEQKQTAFDCQKIDLLFAQHDLYNRIYFSGYGIIAYELNQQQNLIDVQHPMITEVLAQFSSIFNSLLTIGILAKLLAQNHIVEEINSLLLKSYYKKTATKLLKKKDRASENFKEKVHKPDISPEDKSQKMQELQEKINEINFAEDKLTFFKLGIYDRLKLFFSHIFLNKTNETDKQLKENYSLIYMKLWELSVNRINIFELYKDLMQLKMTIKLMLTKEQYAAIQFCGSEILLEDSIKINDILKAEQQILTKDFKDIPSHKVNLPIIPTFHTDRQQVLLLQGNEESMIQLDVSQNKIGETSFFDRSKQLANQITPSANTQINKTSNSELAYQDSRERDKKQNDNIPSGINLIPLQNEGDQPIDMRDSQSMHDFEALQIQTHQINKMKVKLKKQDFLNNYMAEESSSITPQTLKEDFIMSKESKLPIDVISPNLEQYREKKMNTNKKKENQFISKRMTNQSQSSNEFQKISHLQEMDLIEINSEIQQYYLSNFLKSNKNESQSRSLIDEQIFKSLLINE